MCEVTGVLPRVRALAQGVAGLLGPAVATYTAVLVSDTAVPVWHEARRELPMVFAAAPPRARGLRRCWSGRERATGRRGDWPCWERESS